MAVDDNTDSTATPPEAPRSTTVHSAHGLEMPDPYDWLRTARWQEVLRDPQHLEPEIRRHLEAENAYTAAGLAPVAALRETLRAELRARLPERDASVPLADGPWAYYRRYAEGCQHPLYCRRPVDAPAGEGEDVLLDGNAKAEGHAFFRVARAVHAPITAFSPMPWI